ncbi:MAG: Do family serine endopeptidase [Candidatus Nitrohelix vancouverensis]|uniref:Do family serine endopeptidase n=1 Tax=Candidatus Nitrohelix vancouverensis TaxID=2705534 RepID=A0A7T0C2M4_9BACT|nr:MAG: Do family serine endopeptidase [Candidatus Nitrohelix vancouverensis]
MISGSVIAVEAFERRTPIVEAVQKVGPAVVNIYTEETPSQIQNPFRNFGGNFFDQFLKDFMPPISQKRRSLGSGVIIHPDGYVLTNEHVIGKALRIQLSLIDKREFEAHLVGADIRSDLAVVKIDAKEALPYVKMGASSDLMIGESIIAIGNPFGLQHTVTSGIISALNRSLKAGNGATYHDFIQVDASINPGNSGGPLLNINGSLIGVNTAIYQKAEGIGFAIPIDKAKRIVNELIRYGKVRQGWLGASVQDLNPEMQEHFGLARAEGALVSQVMERSPAQIAGVQPGDVVLSINGKGVKNRSEYLDRVATYAIGNSMRMSLWRHGKEMSVSLKVAPLPKDFVERFVASRMGIAVAPITPQTFRDYRLASKSGALVVKVAPQGSAGRMGLLPGDVIRQVNQKKIANLEDFSRAVIEARNLSSVVLLVQRGRNGYYVTLEM